MLQGLLADQSSSANKLVIANALWTKGVTLNPTYVSRMKLLFGVGLRNQCKGRCLLWLCSALLALPVSCSGSFSSADTQQQQQQQQQQQAALERIAVLH